MSAAVLRQGRPVLMAPSRPDVEVERSKLSSQIAVRPLKQTLILSSPPIFRSLYSWPVTNNFGRVEICAIKRPPIRVPRQRCTKIESFKQVCAYETRNTEEEGQNPRREVELGLRLLKGGLDR